MLGGQSLHIPCRDGDSQYCPKAAAKVGDLMIYKDIVAEITELCPDGQYAKGMRIGGGLVHWDLGRVAVYRRIG